MAGSYNSVRSVFTAGGWGRFRSRPLVFALECALGIAAVFLAVYLAHWFAHWPAHGSSWLLLVVVLLYLPIVGLVALLCGFWQAAVVSLFAVAAEGYFSVRQPHLNPAANPVNTIALLVLILLALILTAFTVNRLSARATGQAHEDESWGAQMHDLYEFTQRTLEMNLHAEPGLQLAKLIEEIFGLEAVAVFDADLQEVYQAGYWSVDPKELAQNVYYFETSDDDRATGLGRRVVRLGTVPVGSLVVRGETSPLTNSAMASLVAITFDRYRALANESRIETERQTEQLRATVLDSLAHAYKTPLTAIRAASTGLTEMGHLTAGEADLVTLIDEQAGLLSDLTTRLLTTARLEAGEITMHAAPVGVAPMIEEVLTSLKDRLASMKVVIDLDDEDMVLCCDRDLMVMLLTQYIDNACKYSISGASITIGAECTRAEVIFTVHNYGPMIPMADRERIFDRYYRSSTSSNRATGTGIGLAVAKRVAMIHGGYVGVTSDEREGTKFFAFIPTNTKESGPR